MEAQKHSGLGIASFVVSLVSGFFIFIVIAAAGVLEATTPGGIDEKSASAILIGLALFAFMGTAFIALCLGIAGLLQRERKKIFAVIGTAFSAMSLLGTVFIMVLGMAMGG